MKAVEVSFHEDAIKRVEELKTLTNASNREEVIRNALWLYDWYLSTPGITILVNGKRFEPLFKEGV